MAFAFDNSYGRLPSHFYAKVAPTKVSAPRVVKVNRPLATLLGLDADLLESPEGAALLTGNTVPEGAASIALAYAGHQFGNFVPQLGDGRAILLGEVVGKDGKRRDIQLKGAGRTPFSRGGDGRAALGPVLREYVVSEAMAALGVPTTRALAAATTGEIVPRQEVQPGAVLARVAASHLRVGTFEYFAARGDQKAIATLTRYALERHYPEGVDEGNDALALLKGVMAAQARLVAAWLGVGFVHGVMNTDNTAISGETLDYGPCAFLDEFDPKKTFSSIDHAGRYAFGNQPRIAHWNLVRLAETLLPLLAEGDEEATRIATEQLERFPDLFVAEHGRVLRRKLGLLEEREGDLQLAADLLGRLAAHEVDYTVFFRRLSAAATDASEDADVAAMFGEPGAYLEWAERWRKRFGEEGSGDAERGQTMRRANPALIPRNHRIEELIAAAVDGDFGPFERLVEATARPFEDVPGFEDLREPPKVEERVRATFCGT